MKRIMLRRDQRAFLELLAAAALATAIFVTEASAVSVKETVLYDFGCGSDACGPVGTLVRDGAGNLYGVSNEGGNPSCGYGSGCGAVFELSPNGTGGWIEKVLYAFNGGSDGAFPYAGVILDATGNLYGTTTGGGSTQCGFGGGCGTVYKLSQSGGLWTETVLHSFIGGSDGAFPQAALVFDKAGDLYGTASAGGSETCGGYGCGVVFELTPTSGGWTENVLYSFIYPVWQPTSGLVFDYLGDLYGTTLNSVYGEWGAVFRLIPSTSGWTEETIWSFTQGSYGCFPNGVIVHGRALYGTTAGCGENNVGTAFELTPAIGNWNLHLIHAFTGGNDGGEPSAALTGSQTYLYGATSFGGYYQKGAVFALVPAENGDWTETVLYNFTGGSDGSNPDTPLLLGSGSLTGFANTPAPGGGLIYQITPN